MEYIYRFNAGRKEFIKLTVEEHMKLNGEILMWEHYCELEKDVMGTEVGSECNWCGKTEREFK